MKRAKAICLTSVIALVTLLVYVGYICMSGTDERVSTVIGSRRKEISLYQLKGTIYDHNLKPLTNANTEYYLLVDPRNFERENIDTLCALTQSNATEITKKLEKDNVFVLKSAERPQQLSGVYVYEGPSRYSGTACHLIGYVGSENEGVTGLEKCYNTVLTYFGGQKSVSFATDGLRNPIVGLGLNENGEDGNYKDGVITTLDVNVQSVLENAMRKHIVKGAGVVLDAQSGEIRAMASFPEYDAEHISDYLNGTDGELINRALVGQTVGSVFKIVIAAVALEEGLDGFTYNCSGSIEVNGRSFSCQKEGGHGEVGLEEAFCQSCNAYFIAMGQMLGMDKILNMAERMGFSEKLEIADGLTAPAANLPKNTAVAQQLANFSIGQGELMATPLQIARLLALSCNGGYLVRPSVFRGYYVSGNLQAEKWLNYRSRVIDETVAETLRRLCVSAVENGTGKSAKPEGDTAGGKTASAQTGVYDSDGKEILNTYFAGFYPAENPQYVIVVFAEDGVSGGSTSAPVFKEVCEALKKN